MRATPTINWANPADIVFGTALSGTQLDAAPPNGSVPGTFTYTQAAAPSWAGNNQTLSVTFTPTDTTDYTTASAAATINVLQATPTINWANPADIVFGTALSGASWMRLFWTVGGMSASVPGTFTYTPVAGTVLGTGNNQTLSVSFTPTDTTDYTTAAAYGDDQRLASNAHDHVGQPGEHRLWHGAERHAVGCRLFLDAWVA